MSDGVLPPAARGAARGAADSYITDVDFVDVAHPKMAPVWLDYVAALQGMARSPGHAGTKERYDYCDLGCGTGLSLALLAASDRRGRFVGIDASARHIGQAQRYKDAGKLDNLTFHAATFDAAATLDLPRFDYISIYGVLSWISPAARQNALDFVRARLAPGGLVLVAYDAMPGMAALEPLRHFMLAMTSSGPGVAGRGAAGTGATGRATVDRLAAGMTELRRMKEGGARYFKDHANAARAVDAAVTEDQRYLAHEYLNPHWHLPYFADMRRDLAEIGLSYVGSVMTETNTARLCVPRPLRPAFNAAPDLDARELVKDFAVGRSFRADVFGRDLHRVEGDAQLDLFGGLRFALTDRPWQAVPRSFRFPAGTIDRREPVAGPLLQALAAGPASVDELTRDAGLATARRAEIIGEVALLVAANVVQPALAGPAGKLSMPGGRPGDRYRFTAPLGAAVLDRYLDSARARFLAAPALGAPLQIGSSDALLLLGLVAAGLEGAAGWAAEETARRRLVLANDQGPIADHGALLAHLRARIDRRWKPYYLERLLNFGVIEPAGGA